MDNLPEMPSFVIVALKCHYKHRDNKNPGVDFIVEEKLGIAYMLEGESQFNALKTLFDRVTGSKIQISEREIIEISSDHDDDNDRNNSIANRWEEVIDNILTTSTTRVLGRVGLYARLH
ncbi:hypothetical protein DH2020_021481 [Rehmannia glutinosa]|uniref:Uncharacterized protein n=1 Tax=Rehmannia glutinosa TaxID=99300 RepID=A0ABR0WDL2_REHGL